MDRRYSDGGDSYDHDDEDDEHAYNIREMESYDDDPSTTCSSSGQHLQVFCRLRPMNKLELSRRSKNCIELHTGVDDYVGKRKTAQRRSSIYESSDDDDEDYIESTTCKSLTVDSPLEGHAYDFAFDDIFPENATQETVYEHAAYPVLKDFVRGYNGCIMTYGQTATGKSHTMMGTVEEQQRLMQELMGRQQQSNNFDLDEDESQANEDGVDQVPEELDEDEHDSDSAALQDAEPNGASQIHDQDETHDTDAEVDAQPHKHDKIKIDKDESSINDEPPGIPLNMSFESIMTDQTIELGAEAGIIPRAIHDLFAMIHSAPPEVELTIRCSYVELYMEKLWDLLEPTHKGTLKRLQISNGQINNVSEACCLTEHDMLLLWMRGNACRKLTSQQLYTDSSRSHTLFNITLEQRHLVTGSTKTSLLRLVDLAGSEFATKPEDTLRHSITPSENNHDQPAIPVEEVALMEAKLVHRSLSALNRVVTALADGSRVDVPYRYSKLTELLKPALGGNCRTSVILTASGSSYNIQETLNTFRFGEDAREVVNRGFKVNQRASVQWYEDQLHQSTKRQSHLLDLLHQVRHEWSRNVADDGLLDGIQRVLNDERYNAPSREFQDDLDSDSLASGNMTAEQEIRSLKKRLELAEKQRDQAESALAETMSEVTLLKSQACHQESERRAMTVALQTKSKEHELMQQKQTELEHKLRTSMFRESETTVFFRQFRRFYRRLLKHKASQGSGGDVKDIIAKVPGVPDLSDLIDVDTLLFEAGLIEENERFDDACAMSFRPSRKSLSMSYKAARRATKRQSAPVNSAPFTNAAQAVRQDESSFVKTREPCLSEELNPSSIQEDDAEGMSVESSVTESMNKASQFNGERWTTAREDQLQEELNKLTEKCVKLQLALTTEKSKLDSITDDSGVPLAARSLRAKTAAMKSELDKKSNDLEAVIWKMNELHLINKTYSEKMSNREQNVSYLEETLQDIQNQSRKMLLARHAMEEKLTRHVNELQSSMDALTVPLWQFGESAPCSRNVHSRIFVSLRGGGMSDHVDSQQDQIETAQLGKQQRREYVHDQLSHYIKANVETHVASVQTDEEWPNVVEAPPERERPDTCSVAIQAECVPDLISIAVQTDTCEPEQCEIATQTDQPSPIETSAIAIQTDELDTTSIGIQTDHILQEHPNVNLHENGSGPIKDSVLTVSTAVQTEEAWPEKSSQESPGGLTSLQRALAAATKPQLQEALRAVSPNPLSIAVQTDNPETSCSFAQTEPCDQVDMEVQTETLPQHQVSIQTDQSATLKEIGVQTDSYSLAEREGMVTAEVVIQADTPQPQRSPSDVRELGDSSAESVAKSNNAVPLSVDNNEFCKTEAHPVDEIAQSEDNKSLSAERISPQRSGVKNRSKPGSNKKRRSRTVDVVPPEELVVPMGEEDEVSMITSHFAEQSYFMGGKPSTFVPKRFAPKLGLAIKPGVVKQTSKRQSAKP